jgi:hypothetical protein
MYRSRLTGALCAVVLTLIATASQATLVGVLPATPGGTDYQAHYDTEANLTWLADANAGAGSEYDAFFPDPTGRMTWENANAWVDSLNINGVTGWRLPYTPNNDPTCDYSEGPSYPNCSGSDMGNLFYNVLGGVAGRSIATTHNDTYNLFSNISTQLTYWSTKKDASNVWSFSFADGNVDAEADIRDGGSLFVWPVYSGNAGAVPLPAAIYLFGSGFLGLIGIARRKKAA